VLRDQAPEAGTAPFGATRDTLANRGPRTAGRPPARYLRSTESCNLLDEATPAFIAEPGESRGPARNHLGHLTSATTLDALTTSGPTTLAGDLVRPP